MKLTLVYEGPLKSNGSKEHKHQIRKVFDEQLRAFWRLEPLASHEEYALGHASSDLAEVVRSGLEDRKQNSEDRYVEEVRDEYFLPVVSNAQKLLAKIDITWIRREDPGRLTQMGDIDNRLKTLFDALQTPPENQMPREALGTSRDKPFRTLLEDDNLIAELHVTTKKDLRPASTESAFLLLIDVTTIVTIPTLSNIIFM